jgi:hypothetical protein
MEVQIADEWEGDVEQVNAARPYPRESARPRPVADSDSSPIPAEAQLPTVPDNTHRADTKDAGIDIDAWVDDVEAPAAVVRPQPAGWEALSDEEGDLIENPLASAVRNRELVMRPGIRSRMKVQEQALDTFEKEERSPAVEASIKFENKLSALREELEPLKMSQIKKRVIAEGVAAEAPTFHDAEDSDNPKEAMIQILLDLERSRMDAAAREEALHEAKFEDVYNGSMSGLYGRAKPIDASLPPEEDEDELRENAVHVWNPEPIDHPDDDIGGFEGPRRLGVTAGAMTAADGKLGDTDTGLVFASQKSRERKKYMKVGGGVFFGLVVIFWIAFMISHSATHGDETQQYHGEMEASSVEEHWRNPADADSQTVAGPAPAPQPWPTIHVEIEPESNIPVYMQLSVNMEFPEDAEMETFKQEFVNATVVLINVVNAAIFPNDPFYSIRNSIPSLDDVDPTDLLQNDRVVISSVVPGSLSVVFYFTASEESAPVGTLEVILEALLRTNHTTEGRASLVRSIGDEAVDKLFGENMLQFYVGRPVPASVLMIQAARQRAASAQVPGTPAPALDDDSSHSKSGLSAMDRLSASLSEPQEDCHDTPADWFDNNGDNCSTWEIEQWCAAAQYYSGHGRDLRPISAAEACCACGGGEVAPVAPVAPHFVQKKCYLIVMMDSAGDGWNGNILRMTTADGESTYTSLRHGASGDVTCTFRPISWHLIVWILCINYQFGQIGSF